MIAGTPVPTIIMGTILPTMISEHRFCWPPCSAVFDTHGLFANNKLLIGIGTVNVHTAQVHSKIGRWCLGAYLKYI